MKILLQKLGLLIKTRQRWRSIEQCVLLIVIIQQALVVVNAVFYIKTKVNLLIGTNLVLAFIVVPNGNILEADLHLARIVVGNDAVVRVVHLDNVAYGVVRFELVVGRHS